MIYYTETLLYQLIEKLIIFDLTYSFTLVLSTFLQVVLPV